MSSKQAFITLDDVTLRVGEKRVFEHATWEFLTDQHWAIIGPNGSGKSILVNVFCRKTPLVLGRILYFFDGSPRSYLHRGEVVRISTETHKELLQAHSGYHQARWQSIEGKDAPHVSELLTGESIEHISPYEVSPLQIDSSIYQARRRHALDLLGIEYLLDRKILHLSHGEGRKVLIARALMQSPQLLILDDPFCGLDSASRDNLKQIIHDILALGKPQVLLVTTRLDEIPEGITHIVQVENHHIVKKGPKKPVLQSGAVQKTEGSKTHEKPSFLARFPPVPENQTTQTPVLVDMQETSVSYGNVRVLQNITWTMKHGEHWAILGPNGAGKTTLLSLILADNPRAYANTISLFGRRRGSGESIWDIKRHIGWVSPELQIYYPEDSTCYHVVCSGFFDSIGLYRTYSVEQAETANYWMRALGIEALANQPLGMLSVGERRLVLLARALVKSPTLLILDEPCQGLDLKNRSHILTMLDMLCQHTSLHLIYVTHHVDEMPEAITHVLQLEHGRIRKMGPKHQILSEKISTIENSPIHD